MEERNTELQESKTDMAKRWVQDNLRIIVSVIIVVAIAGGIYSYSKRTENVATDVENSNEVASIVEDKSGETKSSETEKSTEQTEQKNEEQKPAEQQSEDKKVEQTKPEVKTVVPESKETETSFVESAARGEGKTHLARRALANYLEKNPDSALTKEHKIFIEDYLRKNTGEGSVAVGSSVEFSKDSIKNAIEKSKQLNENQLKNLQKYSARVSSL